MHRHPHFDLLLHDDAELAGLLGSPLVGRVTLHEWPLSCVQRIHTADGRSAIYKVQAEPSVEPLFYSRARSPLLVAARMLDGETMPALLLEDLSWPRLADLRPGAQEALRIGQTLIDQIGQITGDLPALFDLRTDTQWASYVNALAGDLAALVAAGRFRQVDGRLIEQLACHAHSPTVLAALHGPTGYVHFDLSGDNVFVGPEGYHVIDWQRPIWGPVALDLAALLASLDLDPRPFVPAGVTQLLDLLHVGWLTQCARHWFPAGAQSYDTAIVRLAARLGP